jgi:hypothetical protein
MSGGFDIPYNYNVHSRHIRCAPAQCKDTTGLCVPCVIGQSITNNTYTFTPLAYDFSGYLTSFRVCATNIGAYISNVDTIKLSYDYDFSKGRFVSNKSSVETFRVEHVPVVSSSSYLNYSQPSFGYGQSSCNNNNSELLQLLLLSQLMNGSSCKK